ncbi:MAG TPA: ABC transporter ATP-binding protein [Verrucomicrobiae bacterium]|jgi:urea transport system ATP-binding protein|nr:ABC transporter ATP-binding protein [Verrucomicrobiae bacterium]
MALLEVSGVSKRFGELRALAGVDLRLEAGQIHGLIGPNGSGKSTLMKCIAGALAPDAGVIRFAGRDLTRAAPSERARAGLSIKFQITSVLPSLSVYDNVLLALQGRDSLVSLLRSATRRARHEAVTAALARFPLIGRADQLAGALSHGEQQWLEIAMALATEPTLLLLDEPTAGMSLEERRLTGELLAPIKTGCAILIVEHDLDFIRGVSDVLTVLDQGTVLDSGSVEAIQASSKVQEVYLTRV